MAKLWLKWMPTAPGLMPKPLSATFVIHCAPVGAVTVPLLPETLACPNLQTPLAQDLWQGVHVCGLCLLSCVPWLQNVGTIEAPELQQLCCNHHAMICWIWGIKDRDETPSTSLIQKLDTKHITSLLCCRRLRWYGHVQCAISCIKSITNFILPALEKKGRPRPTCSECGKTDVN